MTEKISLKRACDAMLIPSGTKVMIAEGTNVEVTHSLGGNFTIKGLFGLARIEGKDADALGKECPKEEVKEVSVGNVGENRFPPPREEDIWEIAKTVYDPEISLNIVDLGLVYRLEIVNTEEGKVLVEADMTLTSPGCAMGPIIAEDLRSRIASIPGVDEAKVSIVWEPVWHKDMITEEGKMILGIL